jgi:hypothetical protein
VVQPQFLPRRARIEGSKTFVSLNSRLESRRRRNFLPPRHSLKAIHRAHKNGVAEWNLASDRCRATSAHTRLSQSDSRLGCDMEVLKAFHVVAS